MELVRGSKDVRVTPADRGYVGWILDAFSTLRARQLRGQMRTVKQLQVLETLQLGGRRQLVLVNCGTERFLVGCGADQVQTIVQVGLAVAGPCAEDA